MRLNIYSIFDTASGLYLRPLFAQSDGQALRTFYDCATSAENEIGSHPEDYTLFRLGMFDDNTGELTQEENTSLSTALEMVAKSRKINSDQKQNNLDLDPEIDLSPGLTD